MRRLYLRIAAAAVVASTLSGAAVAFVVPAMCAPPAAGADALVAGPLPGCPLERLVMAAVLFALMSTATASAAVAVPLAGRLRRLSRGISDLGNGSLEVRLNPNEGELSELVESINGMASRLQCQFEEREALLQAVSHEIGTPLSRMRFSIELLQDEARGKAQAKRLHALTADLDELDRLSSELVAWMDPQGAKPRKHEFLVAPAIESLADGEYSPSGTFVRVSLRTSPELTIVADQRQFQRAIENLLRNALRYAQEQVVIHGFADGERVVVEVRDDGPGIARDQWERVLDPFVRLDGDRSCAHRRLGLGLAIVRRIVEAHGGGVVVADAPEGGTRVRTCWPRGGVYH